MDQPTKRFGVWMLSEEDWGHIDALASKYDWKMIQKVFSQYSRWSMQHLIFHASPQVLTSLGRQSQPSMPSSSNEKLTVGQNPRSASDADTYLSIATTLVPQATSLSPTRIYFCTYHHEFGGPLPTFRKKGDCKAHMMKFHNLGKEWTCPMCHWIFDTDNDLLKHCHVDHPRWPLPPITDIVTQLLPKQIFACGFHGCERLFSFWDEWFDHVANHMRNGLTPSDWQYSLVIANLLHQTDLHKIWEYFLFQTYGTAQPLLEWTPSTSRQLCQKLECQDFRPCINYLVHAAHQLGQPKSVSTNPASPPALQICLRTPSCDSIPSYRDNEQLDDILMRPVKINLSLRLSNNHYPPSPCSTVVDPEELRNENSTSQISQAMPITRSFDLEDEVSFSTIASASFPNHTQEPTHPFPQFTAIHHDESFCTSLKPDPSRSTFYPNTADHSSTANISTQPEALHILQQFNYFDYDRFVREHTPCPLNPISLARRSKS